MENTPRNFALQLGSLITLYISIVSVNVLLFGVITIIYPDAVDSYWQYNNAAEAIRFSIAMLIVFFPAYLILTRMVNQIRRVEDTLYLHLTKWLIYLSLLVGGGVLLGDFVAVIYGWLEGEITLRFLLKAGVLALTVAAPLVYYIYDAKGHWQKNEKGSIMFGLGAAVFVIIALVLGFMNSETPQEVRDARIDDNQIQDLQDMQWRIEDYHRSNGVLPESVAVVYEGSAPPTAPLERSPYQYNVTGDTTYELCATFAVDSAASKYTRPVPVAEKNYNWSHGEGEWCFERTVETPEDRE